MTQRVFSSRLIQLTELASTNANGAFEMLHTCHHKVHRMLGILRKLQEHLESSACDEQARQAAGDIMRYFDLAAPLHHQDEELHIFPPLLASGHAELCESVERLLAEHRQMEQLWALIRPELNSIAQRDDGGSFTFTSSGSAAMDQFVALYPPHIELEEAVVYIVAKDYFDSQAQQAMMRDMLLRRGANPAEY